MSVEFDPAKNKINIRRHGIDLAETEGVFFDPHAITIEDRDSDEQRFLTIGSDVFGRILVVCYTWRGDDVIRVISAREAEPLEHKDYEG